MRAMRLSEDVLGVMFTDGSMASHRAATGSVYYHPDPPPAWAGWGSDQYVNARLFHLQRDEDVSGVSGGGVVAEGVEFARGWCVMRWLTATASTAIYATIDDLVAIHGHNGATRVVWLDENKD